MVTLKPCPNEDVASSVGPIVLSLNTSEAVLASPARSILVFNPILKTFSNCKSVLAPIVSPIFINATLQDCSKAPLTSRVP